MPTTTDPEVTDYLNRLRAAAVHLPADEFADAWAAVTEHLDAAAERGESPRAALARLGTPEEIVAGYGRTAPAPAPPEPVHVVVTTPARPEMSIRLHEMAALILLPFGGFLAGVGWLVGILLLWTSDRWRWWEKVLGTLVPVGLLGVVIGTAVATAQAGAGPCTAAVDGTADAGCGAAVQPHGAELTFLLLLAALVAAIAVPVYLAFRAWPGRAHGARRS